MDRSCTGRCASPTSSQWCPQGRSPLQIRTSASLKLLADQGDVVRHAQHKTDQQRGTALVPLRAVGGQVSPLECPASAPSLEKWTS